ncbi:hypothetical protein KJ815_01475, partial [bacterium]|nr:hypothetical protein [bacterium]
MKSAILRCAALAVLISLTGQGLAMAPSERGDRLSDAQVVKKTVLDGSRNVGSLKAEIEEILTQVARGDDIPRLKARLDSLRSLLPRRMPERSMDTGGERCEDAVTVPSLPFCDTGSTTGALNDYICQSGAFGSPDRVYLYTPEIDKTVTISLCGSGYDTGLHIWQSCPDDTEAVEICCDDDHCGLQSCCNGLSLLAGTAYYIIVDGYGSGSAGNYVI